jgi:hypothetical protein
VEQIHPKKRLHIFRLRAIACSTKLYAGLEEIGKTLITAGLLTEEDYKKQLKSVKMNSCL